jgi:glutamine amidotransferase
VKPVVIVDYGSGNLRSLSAGLRRAGTRVVVSADPRVVASSSRLMVPGQGAAGPTMTALRNAGLVAALRGAVAGGAYLLGICVGLQLLFEGSEENETPCFGFLPGRVTRLRGVAPLPHMGWNDVVAVRPDHPLTAGLPACAYFAHTYAVTDAGPAALAETDVDGVRFAAIVGSGRVAGAQFHPERSAAAGLRLLRGFLEWSDAA